MINFSNSVPLIFPNCAKLRYLRCVVWHFKNSIKTDCSLACFKEMNLQQLQEEMIVVLLASIFPVSKEG